MPQHRRGFILLFFKILLHSLFPSPLDSYLLLSFGLLCVCVCVDSVGMEVEMALQLRQSCFLGILAHVGVGFVL